MDWFTALKCPSCGSAFKESERYCPNCGTDLELPLERSPALAREYFEKAQQKYDRNSNLQTALSECDLALGYNPEFAEAHNLRGLILDALNQTEDAIAAYREAIRLNPGLQEARANLQDAEIEKTVGRKANFAYAPDSEEKRKLANIFITVFFVFLALVILAGSGWFVLQIAIPYLTPKTEIVLAPDIPDDVQVTQSDLELAAQILTDRAELLEYPQVTFEATSNGSIIGKLPVSMDALELVGRIGSIGLLEFVDFGETPLMAGTIVRTDFENEYITQIEGKTWHTIMSNDGILATNVHENTMQGANINYQIDIAMTETGTKIFAEHTQNNIGTYLGIVLDKTVISAPIINDAITGGQATITGNFTEQSAKNLAAAFMTQPLPFPIILVKR